MKHFKSNLIKMPLAILAIIFLESCTKEEDPNEKFLGTYDLYHLDEGKFKKRVKPCTITAGDNCGVVEFKILNDEYSLRVDPKSPLLASRQSSGFLLEEVTKLKYKNHDTLVLESAKSGFLTMGYPTSDTFNLIRL